MGLPSRMDKGGLKMVLLTYPLLLAVDALVLQAVVPSHLAVLQIAHAVLGVCGFVWLLRAYRRVSVANLSRDDQPL